MANAVLFALLLPLATDAQPGSNAAPAGSWQYDIKGHAGSALWSFSGLYNLPFYGLLRLHHCADGEITASPETGDTNNVLLTGMVIGNASRLKMRLRSTSELWEWRDFGFEYPFWDMVMRKDDISMSFHSANGTLTGNDRIRRTWSETVYYNPSDPFSAGDKMKIVRHSRTSVEPITVVTPLATDGNWTLQVNIVPSGDKLSGTASVVLSNGESIEFDLDGRYLARGQRAKLVLKGAGDDTGAALALTLVGADMELESLRGRIGGQSVRFP